jgi:hypothetical protein
MLFVEPLEGVVASPKEPKNTPSISSYKMHMLFEKKRNSKQVIL